MLGPKEKLLAQFLFQNRNQFVTSKVLADQLGCSDRTVRNYLKNLTDELAKVDGLELQSKQGYGYQLIVEREGEGLEFLIDKQIPFGKENVDISDRHNYIINKLIFEQENLLLEDLADQLYVSRSTLSADLKKIRSVLAKHHLTIESRANKGIYVQGEEHHKRRFIMDYFFNGHFLKHFQSYVSGDILNLPISLEELTMIVLDGCRNEELSLSDYVIQNLVIHIALAIKRLEDGFQMSPIDVDKDKFAREFRVAKGIVERLEERSQIHFPQEEATYIALHLISKGRNPQSKTDAEGEHRLQEELAEAFRQLDGAYGSHFFSDYPLMEGLLTHFRVLLERLTNRIHLTNPLVGEIKEQYPDAFELTKQFVKRVPSLAIYPITDDELAYIALHLMAAQERYKEKKKVKVLVICATGYGSAQMLKHRIINELNPCVHVVDVVGYYDLDDELLKGVDLIISSIDLSTLVFSVPVVTVSVFLKDEEVARVKEALSKIDGKHPLMDEKAGQNLETIFDDYFSQDMFFIEEQLEKKEVLDRLVDCLNETGDNGYHQKMLELIQQREQMSTVVFNDQIAVPHPIKAYDKRHKIAVGIVRQGVDWDQHFHAIKLVFLVSPSIYENDGLADLTTLLVQLTDRPDLQAAICDCHDYQTFKTLLLSVV